MSRSEQPILSVLFGVLLASAALAQPGPAITMDKVMTGEQLRATSVDSLSPGQRPALDRWLSDYTLKVIQFARNSQPSAISRPTGSTYLGSSGGHWIKSKADNGTIVVLEDGSMWRINSLDRIYTALWLPISNVAVLRADSAVGEYKYALVNTDDGEKALAKYLGRQ